MALNQLSATVPLLCASFSRPLFRAAAVAVKLMLPSALLIAMTTTDAPAQRPYPSQTIKIVVGFPAGTTPDTLARLVADGFQTSLGQPVIVENTVGAGGNIAADRVAKSEPDGYTLLMAGNAALVVNQSLYDKLPYDPVRDFMPISQVVVTPNVLIVHPDVAASSVRELVALAKAKPDALAYAHIGLGTSQHLAAEILKSEAGVSMRGVAYRGGNTSLPDLLAGRVQVCFCNIATAAPLIKDGKLRALAITSPTRSPIAPELPTMQEVGFPGFTADAWFGLVAPAGTPEPVAARVHAEVAKLLAEPKLRKTLTELGMVPIGNTPKDFAHALDQESRYWAATIKRLDIKMN